MLLFSCENRTEDVEKLTGGNKLAQVETSKEVTITYSDSAQVKAVLKAKELVSYHSETPYLEMPKGLNVDFYSAAGVVQSKLSARYGIRFENQKRVTLRDNVVVTNDKGERLDTERLYWDEKKQLLYSDKFVKISTADKVIYGEGFESNQNFTRYKIFKIKGMVSLNEKE